MSRECGFKEHDLDYTARDIDASTSMSEIGCRRCGIRMTVTLRSSGRIVRPDVQIYPATDSTTISRDMIGYFFASYGPTLDKLKGAGVIFFTDNVGGPGQLAAAVRELDQAAASKQDPVRLPLLLMTDQEGGLVRRSCRAAGAVGPADRRVRRSGQRGDPGG